VKSAAFSPDGKRVVTGSDDYTARIWDAETAKEIAVLRAHEGGVSSTAFSPDGERIVTGSYDRTARVWDAASAKEVAILREQDAVLSAAFSPDGKRIVTASPATVRIWDVATANEIMVLQHKGHLRSAESSPGGERVVTASDDTTAQIWDVHFTAMSTKDLLVEACTRRLRGFTKLSRNEMRLAGYSDDAPPIDACAGAK
jgi:WD40 repeat protein